ncbi:hypothetical protein CGG82_18060 [Vibrio parahaemolyticus]|uniref:hypothetical protein n=1 Tax=Vibrio parahaemolyticus TaxID=670 RepID=UPI0011235ADF|nr:hypothetical protein [Vibrio parahaemolyticus]TOR11947.1 hypothetical protein CGG82_18060 [Vibrio parahaemolyticus]UJW92793.1 hypothetical protein JHS83_25195 [Vibrio parahaemolyticus]UJX06958.1 hypothetical protein JHS88_24845 [Vibrio parahaemolyticus]UJX06979.1 hypothetical protein JHS88_25365 [Vibrio parahaemolyticus]WCZ09813.1 hypothetical protein GSR97_26525 [Vibrio parahaemolyticus]
MIVVRLEASKDISGVVTHLSGLGYEECSIDRKVAFVYRKDSSSSQFLTDLKVAKSASKFSGQIKCVYGSTSVTK